MKTEPKPKPILGIAMDADTRNKIRQAAAIEERTESAFARRHLVRAAEAVIAGATIETTNTEADL